MLGNGSASSSRGRRSSTVQDVRELAAHHPGKALETAKCGASRDARSVLEQSALSTSSSSGLATLTRSALTLSSPSYLTLDEEDTRQSSSPCGDTQLLDSPLPVLGQCTPPSGDPSSATAGLAVIRPRRLNRLYLKPIEATQPTVPACVALSNSHGDTPTSAGRRASGVLAACAASAAGGTHGNGITRGSGGTSSSGGGTSNSGDGGGSGASPPPASNSSSAARSGGGDSTTRHKRLAPVNLRVTSSPTVSQHAGSAMFASAAACTAVMGASSSVLGGAAEEAGEDLLSDEGEQSVTVVTDPDLLADSPHGAEQHPHPAMSLTAARTAPVSSAAAAILRPAASAARARPHVVSTVATKQSAAMDLVTRLTSVKAIRQAGVPAEPPSTTNGGGHVAAGGTDATAPPASWAAGHQGAPAATVRLPCEAQPSYDTAALPAHGQTGLREPSLRPHAERPGVSGKEGNAAGLAAAAAASSSRATCRIHMKLHSSSPEQLKPSMLAPLVRLMLPYGWSLRGLAVRSGCLELVLEYERLDGGMGPSGNGAGSHSVGAAAAAVPGSEKPPLSDDAAGRAAVVAATTDAPMTCHVAELVSYLHQQGLVNPSQEPAVAVQVNQLMCRVQWRGQGGAGAGDGRVAQSGSVLAGGSSMLPSWCTDAALLDVPPTPQGVSPSTAAASMSAAVTAEPTAPAPAAGSWQCQAAPAYLSGAGAVMNIQPTVTPVCVVAPWGLDTAALYIAVPGTGLHSPTVRCLGSYLPVQQLHHLSASTVNQQAAAAAAAMAAPPMQAARGDVGGTVAPQAVVDWAAASTAAAAAGPCGEVFIVRVGGLPRHCALLQVELRVGSSPVDSWSPHTSGTCARDLHRQMTAGQQGVAPGQPPAQHKGASLQQELPLQSREPQQLPLTYQCMSAAAPVLLLRTRASRCFTGRVGLDGGHPNSAPHLHGLPGAVGSLCSLREATTAAEELAQLQARLLGSSVTAVGPVAAETAPVDQRTAAVVAAALPTAEGMALEAAREFVNDLGLLLDAAACVGLEEEKKDEEEDVQGSGVFAGQLMTAPSHGLPSYSDQVRGLLLQQLGLSSTGDSGGHAVAPQLLRQHLADTAVTLLAGCIELFLPYTARLVVEITRHWLRLCSMDVLLMAASSEGGVAPTESLMVRLEALLRGSEEQPASPRPPQGMAMNSDAGSGGSCCGDGAVAGSLRGMGPAASVVECCGGPGGPGAARRLAPRLSLSAGALDDMQNLQGCQAPGRWYYVTRELDFALNVGPGPASGPKVGGGPWSGTLGQAPAAVPVTLNQPGLLGMTQAGLLGELQQDGRNSDAPVAPHSPSTAPPLPSCTHLQQPSAQPVRYKRFEAGLDGTAPGGAEVMPPGVLTEGLGLLAAPVATSGLLHDGLQDLGPKVNPKPAAVADSLPGSHTGILTTGFDTAHAELDAPCEEQQRQQCTQGQLTSKMRAEGCVASGGASMRRQELQAAAAPVVAPASDTAAWMEGAAAVAGGRPPTLALLRDFGSQVLASFTGFAAPHQEQTFWQETTARLQIMCRLYAGFTLAFVSLSVARAFYEDGAAAAALMALYQGGQALLLAAFGLMGDGRPERLFGTAVASTVLRAVCHTLLSRRLAPLPSFVLPMCRIWVDVFNEGVAKAVFEQLPVWLFLTLMVFLELPTAYALYVFLDGNGAGLLCGCLLLRLTCFGVIRTTVVVGTQAAWRMRFLARRRGGQAKLE